MVQKQVFRSQDRCIYRIQESNLDFYILIPNSPRVNLVLGLISSVTDDKIINVSDIGNKAIVFPVFPQNILLGIQQNEVNYFEYLDKYFSALLNLSHKILVHNKLEVLSTIYFYSENNFLNFQSWFIQKYQGRVQATSISFDQIQTSVQSQSVEPLTNEVKPELSKENSSPFVSSTITEEPVVTSSEEVIVSDKVKPTEVKEPGFVSYVLLGVVFAILTLIGLYFIL